MNHTAVVPGLLAGERQLFFENHYTPTRLADQEFACSSQADNTRADNGKIVVARGRPGHGISTGIIHMKAPCVKVDQKNILLIDYLMDAYNDNDERR